MSPDTLIEDCMTKESLQSIPLEDLSALAREQGYEEDGAIDRATLTEFILESQKDRAREKEQENSLAVRVEDSKYQITDAEPKKPVEPDLYPIANRYNQTKIVFMVRDPHWAFAYWEIDDKAREKISDKGESQHLFLRVRETDSGRHSSFDIPVQFGDSSWYIYLPNQDCGYVLELGKLDDRGYTCMARSNPIRTPREELSQSTEHALDWHRDFNAYYGIGGSGSIPQRILAVGGE
jgi:hypothetical protein